MDKKKFKLLIVDDEEDLREILTLRSITSSSST